MIVQVTPEELGRAFAVGVDAVGLRYENDRLTFAYDFARAIGPYLRELGVELEVTQ